MKKFLRRLEFVISTTDEEGRERHLETYAWRISYSQGPNGTLYTINDGPMIKSKEELKKQVSVSCMCAVCHATGAALVTCTMLTLHDAMGTGRVHDPFSRDVRSYPARTPG